MAREPLTVENAKALVRTMSESEFVAGWLENEDRRSYSTKTARVYVQCVLGITSGKALVLLSSLESLYQKPVRFHGQTLDGGATAGAHVTATYYDPADVARLMWRAANG